MQFLYGEDGLDVCATSYLQVCVPFVCLLRLSRLSSPFGMRRAGLVTLSVPPTPFQTGDGCDDLLTFLARNYHALSYKYSLISDVFQRSGLDLSAAPTLHDEVQSARKALEAFAAAPGSWQPEKGSSVEVRGRLDESGEWERSNLGSVWRTGVVTRVRAKHGEGYFDVEVGCLPCRRVVLTCPPFGWSTQHWP